MTITLTRSKNWRNLWESTKSVWGVSLSFSVVEAFFPPHLFKVKLRLRSCQCVVDLRHVCRETLTWQPRATAGAATATFILLVLPLWLGSSRWLRPVLTEPLFSLLPRPLSVGRFPLFFSHSTAHQALTPLCEDDNQSMEIIQRLQKNLDILIQSMTRVSSRSEMLGAIHQVFQYAPPSPPQAPHPYPDTTCIVGGSETSSHITPCPPPPLRLSLQENRIGKAVEVMIQHVENLRRMYTKEHAELLELRETLMQNERSFGSHTERGEATSFIWINTHQ